MDLKLDLEIRNVDYLTDMLKASFSWENWTAMIEIADKLFETTSFINVVSKYHHTQEKYTMKRCVAYYFGNSLCMKGIALKKTGQYAEARKCIVEYSDLSWVNCLDEENLGEVNYYRDIAKANSYVLDLLEGNTSVLEEYVDFIRNSGGKELIPGLITVLESAITYGYSIDSVLSEFEGCVKEVSEGGSRVALRQYIDYIYLLAAYHYKQGRTSCALNVALHTLLLSGKAEDRPGFIKTAALYEQLRRYADHSQQQAYQNIMYYFRSSSTESRSLNRI